MIESFQKPRALAEIVANPEHLARLKEGVEAWNLWREWDTQLEPNFSEADFSGADLRKANLYRSNFWRAKLRGADLREAKLAKANLALTDLRDADLSDGDFSEANFMRVRLDRANLSRANLVRARLFDSNLREANLTNCRVYGISAWDVSLEGAIQSNLIISRPGESVIQADNLELAQFLYLLSSSEKIRHVIDTITSKVVLILGRFTPERKVVLDAIREEIRKRDYLPVLFDFEKPSSRDITETVRILAHMARFVIADITDARSIPQELMAIVPNLPSVPIQPLLLESQHVYGMFEHFLRFPWVLEPVLYKNQEALLMELESRVIAPAEAKAKAQTRR